jgi:predicted CopG family antitoxin
MRQATITIKLDKEAHKALLTYEAKVQIKEGVKISHSEAILRLTKKR